MRKIKRIVALVVVAMFLLSLFAPAASAATKEDAFGRLNALNVAVGDETGNPQYDKNFTRAEAAAIMVNLSGMNSAIAAAKGQTKFKDVPGSHWASGVINLAVGAGIIKGYPDGTYRPDANVTYAEMSAMLVGVLGYTPKLQGTWPSNVIGKAAQLGLLDGVSVSDYNSAALRSNVFLASDNALDTKALKETKDGYEEDTKTLMESKLSVTKKLDGIVTNVPALSGTKDKITVDYSQELTVAVPAGVTSPETLTLGAGVDANAKLGMKVAAWLKDDKVFFLDVKTDASDIINDKLDETPAIQDVGLPANAGTIGEGDTIHLDKADKAYTLNSTPHVYKNFGAATTTLADLAKDDEVTLILNNGKVEYLIAKAYTTAMVEKVDTTNEKLTFEVSGSLDLKDKVNTIVKGGKTIALGDIKPGNVVDYIATADSRYIIVSDGVVEGKLESAVSAGNKVTLSGKAISTNDKVKISTNNGDTYSALSGATPQNDAGTDYTSHFGKNIKGFTNKDGKIAFIIATEGDASNYIPVLVKDIKRSTGGATDATYIYIAKFDGTETYYEVTKDSKIDGTKVVEVNLKTSTATGRSNAVSVLHTASDDVVRGDIIKISLTSDNKIDNMQTYDTDDIINAQGANLGAYTDFTANKTAATITTGGVAYKVDANTKILKVKAYKDDDANSNDDAVSVGAGPGLDFLQDTTDSQVVPAAPTTPVYVDDVDGLAWSGMENLGNVAGGRVGIIADNGVAKYVVLFNANVTTGSSYKYGMLTNLTESVDGNSWVMKVDGADMTKLFANGATPAKGDIVKFKLDSKDKVDSGAVVTDIKRNVSGSIYEFYKIKTIDKANKRLELVALNANSTTATEMGTKFWIDVNDTTKYFDAEDTAAISAESLDTLNSDDVVKIYDEFDKDNDDRSLGAPLFDTNELVYDFIVRVNK